MHVLELEGWVQPVQCRRDGTPRAWAVNPAVHDGRFAAIADNERARRAKYGKASRRTALPKGQPQNRTGVFIGNNGTLWRWQLNLSYTHFAVRVLPA